MKTIRVVNILSAISLAGLVMSGCSTFIPAHKRAMEVEDIISMTKSDVGMDIITRQIEATRSRFMLDADTIIRLKEAGVEDSVIEAMIGTDEVTEYTGWEQGYAPYHDWLHYQYLWYPGYAYSGNQYYVDPYTGVPRSKHPLIGQSRYYPYVPVYPPTWDFKRQKWIYPKETESVPEENDR
ncbi:MAG TPA: hypothetical protein VMZ04_00800 [Anaerolineae bacterium]|nr:hypothetical protein [Anaerolineae bacterium]